MYYIVIRESHSQDLPGISDLIRNAYISNVSKSFYSALFNELTFQIMVLLAAFMFIFMGVPLIYCISAIPIVLLFLYGLIYGSILMKAAELVHAKRPLLSWVAEAYEPYFFAEKPQKCYYRIVHADAAPPNEANLRRTIVGTCSVMKHHLFDDWSWLFRVAVAEPYRKKGVGMSLTQTAQHWCRHNRFNCMEVAITECQEEARQLFANAGFEVKQMYHKNLFTSLFKLQMFQLRSELRPTFH